MIPADLFKNVDGADNGEGTGSWMCHLMLTSYSLPWQDRYKILKITTVFIWWLHSCLYTLQEEKGTLDEESVEETNKENEDEDEEEGNVTDQGIKNVIGMAD